MIGNKLKGGLNRENQNSKDDKIKIKENNLNEKEKNSTNPKYLELKCKNCKTRISKKGITRDLINEFLLKNNFAINFIYLSCCLPDNKTKRIADDGYLYLCEAVKCINCGTKFGMLIKSACGKTREFLDCVIFSHDFVEV
jgi:hypothetical protein